jgi:hypothetical protein
VLSFYIFAPRVAVSSAVMTILLPTKINCCLSIKCAIFLSDFKSFGVFTTQFIKSLQYDILRKSFHSERADTCRREDGRTDIKKLVGAFRDLC